MVYSSQVAAFVDETGNTDLDMSKLGVSSHFILVAVVVEAERLHEIRHAVEAIRAKEFQKAEMKSSLVGKNKNRRIRIWKSLISPLKN